MSRRRRACGRRPASRARRRARAGVEECACAVVRRVIAEVVEAGLADRDRARVARGAAQLVDAAGLRAAGLVRMDAEHGEDVVVLPPRARAPRARPRRVVATRDDARHARRRVRARGPPTPRPVARCACVSITRRCIRASSSSTTDGVELPEERRRARAAAGPPRARSAASRRSTTRSRR